MREQIQDACDMLLKMLQRSVPESKQLALKNHFAARLEKRAAACWYPSEPSRGSGHRCVLVSCGNIDPILVESAVAAGVASNSAEVGDLLPPELAMWVDPGEVSVRIGNSGPVWPVSRFLQADLAGDGQQMRAAGSSGYLSGARPSFASPARMASQAATAASTFSVMAPSFWPAAATIGHHPTTPTSHQQIMAR